MIIVLTLFVLFLLESNFFLWLMNLYLVPQIIHNVMRGGRIDFDINYMLVIGLRAFLPVRSFLFFFNNDSYTSEVVQIISSNLDLPPFSVFALY